jgi:hypothetical protein
MQILKVLKEFLPLWELKFCLHSTTHKEKMKLWDTAIQSKNSLLDKIKLLNFLVAKETRLVQSY